MSFAKFILYSLWEDGEIMKKKKLTYNSLALGNLKNRKKHYTLMIVGIILSMIFSSGIIYFAYSIYDTTVKQTEADYGFYNWFDSGYNESIFEELKANKYLDEYGTGSTLGFIFTDEKDKINGTLVAKLDETAKKLVNPIFLDGNYPEKKGEIAIEQTTLLQLGLSAKVGDKITFKYHVQNGAELFPDTKEKTYTLTGILRDKRSNIAQLNEKNLLPAAFVSDCETVELGGKANTIVYSVVNYGNMKGVSDWEIRMSKGMEPEPTIWAYKPLGHLATSIDGFTNIITIIVVIGILLLASSLGIINTFTSNLKERKKQIGFYRAVGATKKQIFSLYMRETLILSTICTPISLLISFFAVKFIIVTAFTDYFFSPNLWVLLICGAFGVLFVFFASLIPLFSAMRITPMQSIRNIETTRKFRNKKIKLQNNFNVSNLIAKRNIIVSKRKQVVVGIFLTITIFLSNYAISYMTFQYDNIDSLRNDYETYLGQYSYDAINCPETNNGFSENHLQTLLNHESIKSVYATKEVTAIIACDASTISSYRKILISELLGFDNILNPEDVNKENYLEYFGFFRYSGEEKNNIITDIKNVLGYDNDIFEVTLTSIDEEEIENLSKGLISGKINIEKLNSGEQVLVVAPEKLRIILEKDTQYGNYIRGSRNSEYIENLIKNNPDVLIATENCDFTAGETLDIGVIYTNESPVYDYDSTNNKPYLEKENIVTQNRAEVEVGGVLDLNFVEDAGISYEFIVLTTHQGMQKFLPEAKYKEFRLTLKDECTEETDKEICNLLDSVITCVDKSDYISNYAYKQLQKDTWKNYVSVIFSIVILLYTVCGSIINNTVMATIKEDKKKIGTLRAVGANESEISKSYILQIVSMFKWGVGIGFSLFCISYAILKILEPTKEFIDMFKFNPWITLLLTIILFGICSLSVYSKIRKETKNSIVENIREL